MQHDALDHLVGDGMHRRKGIHGFLENHVDIFAADAADLVAHRFQRNQIDRLASGGVEKNAARGFAWFANEAKDRFYGNAFATAGFAHQAEDFTPFQVKRNIIHCAEDTAGQANSVRNF